MFKLYINGIKFNSKKWGEVTLEMPIISHFYISLKCISNTYISIYKE